MIRIDLGGISSWLMVIILGIIMVQLLGPMGWWLITAGCVLGGIYFILDLWNKI